MDATAAALSWANEVALLGSDREQVLEHENLLMGCDQAHAAMQGFSLMMMAGQPSYSMIMMGGLHEDEEEEQEQQTTIRNPSTVLSLQTVPASNEENQSHTEENNPVNPKKRGRQKGPGKPKDHYVKERESSFQLVLKLPLKSRKLFCVAEFYKYMAQSSSDSHCKVTEAYARAGESVGVSGKTARKWVEDWERRADGTFSESQQGKHVKVEWLLQPEHLQNKARTWIEQNCPKKGDPPRKDSIVKMFRDFCNNELLVNVQTKGAGSITSNHRRISTETARSWLHRLGFNNFKDFKKSSTKVLPNQTTHT